RGIVIDKLGGNVIAGNFIGTDAKGSAAVGNTLSGVDAFSAGNTIGGTAPADRNLISGTLGLNGGAGSGGGIRLFGAGAKGNLVEGNFLGANAAGTGALPNSDGGILIDGAPNNT